MPLASVGPKHSRVFIVQLSPTAGQSKLMFPNARVVPCTVHGIPSRAPPTHVPVDSSVVPVQVGHGCSTEMPVKIDAMIGKLDSPDPPSGLIVPVTGPATRFVKHTG